MEYQKTRIINKEIPDENLVGFRDEIWINRNLTILDAHIEVEFEHPVGSELAIVFAGPKAELHTLSGPGKLGDNQHKVKLSGGYLSSLAGSKSKGKYLISIVDTAKGDVGKVVSWTLLLSLKNSKKSEIHIGDSESFNSAITCQSDKSIKKLVLDVECESKVDKPFNLVLTSPSGMEAQFSIDPRNGRSQTFEKHIEPLVSSESLGEWQLNSLEKNQNLNGILKKWKLTLHSTQTLKGKDDLTKIEGIGPKIEQLLNNENIYTFEHLASASVQTLKSILEKAGPRFQMHEPTTWPRQSSLAAKGSWEELTALQDELLGGK